MRNAAPGSSASVLSLIMSSKQNITPVRSDILSKLLRKAENTAGGNIHQLGTVDKRVITRTSPAVHEIAVIHTVKLKMSVVEMMGLK